MYPERRREQRTMKQTTIHGIQSQASKNQAEFELRETVEEFNKDIMAIVKSSVPEAVTWQELLEEMHSDTELSDLKEAIARGYSMAQEKRGLGPQYDSIFTKLAVVGGLVVRGPRIVATRTLRNTVVKLANKGHQGITNTREYLRTRVWFPGLDKMVEAHIQNGPPVPSGECVTRGRAVTHDTHAK